MFKYLRYGDGGGGDGVADDDDDGTGAACKLYMNRVVVVS